MAATTLIRTITRSDDKHMAAIIRASLVEFGAAKPGTVYYDPTTDHLSELFTVKRGIYYVAEPEGVILGGAGIYPTKGLDNRTCELVKMYLSPSARGKGIGRMLMKQCIDFAKAENYKQIYLETMPELKQAIALYQKFGFEVLPEPMGSTGHFGCSIWMLKDISKPYLIASS